MISKLRKKNLWFTKKKCLYLKSIWCFNTIPKTINTPWRIWSIYKFGILVLLFLLTRKTHQKVQMHYSGAEQDDWDKNFFYPFIKISWPWIIYYASHVQLVHFQELFSTLWYGFSIDLFHATCLFPFLRLSDVLRVRSSHQRCSIKKGVLKNFAKFTGKHLCQRGSLFQQSCKPQASDPGTGVFLLILRNF